MVVGEGASTEAVFCRDEDGSARLLDAGLVSSADPRLDPSRGAYFAILGSGVTVPRVG